MDQSEANSHETLKVVPKVIQVFDKIELAESISDFSEGKLGKA